MSQNYHLVSTSRPAPALTSQPRDELVSYAGSLPLAYLALFDPVDVFAIKRAPLPVVYLDDGSRAPPGRQLTLFVRKDVAITRLERRIAELATRVARDLSVLASAHPRRGESACARPTAVEVTAELEQFAKRLAAAAGNHVQVFLHHSYIGWDDTARDLLTRVLSAGHAHDAGWTTFLELWEYTNDTAPPWSADRVTSSLIGDVEPAPAAKPKATKPKAARNAKARAKRT